MKKLNLVSLMVVFVLSLTVFAACSKDDKDNSSKGSGKQTYKVGVDASYPPFEWKENGEYKGIDIDLIREIAKRGGFEIEIQSMDFKGIIPALQSKQLDIAIAGMTITDERRQVLDFSDPYFDAGLSIVVGKNNEDVNGPDDLANKTVAVKKGTFGATYATENLEPLGAKVIQFDSSATMFEEVLAGRADALIEDYPVIAYAIVDNGLDLKIVGERLNEAQYGIGTLKGSNPELVEKINNALKEMREDGTYQEIIDKYLKE